MMRQRILCAVASLSMATTGQANPLCPWDCVPRGGDGTVGIADFLLLLAQWGVPATCDNDGGSVGITDFLALLSNWGPCPIGGACCNPGDGVCEVLTPADCTAAGGVYGGDGTDCTDSDFDRIPDAFELNTCESVRPCFSGSHPDLRDTDGDLLIDGDEFYGSLGGLDLPAMGAPSPPGRTSSRSRERIEAGSTKVPKSSIRIVRARALNEKSTSMRSLCLQP